MEAPKRDLENEPTASLRIKNLDFPKERKEFEKEIKARVSTPNEEKMAKIRSDMKTIVEAGIKRVNATTVLHEKVKFDGKNTMTINDKEYAIEKNVHMVAWGKEVSMLGAAFERIIGDHLKTGWLVVPRGTVSHMWTFTSWLPKMDTCITYLEAGSDNGLPDEGSIEASRTIAEYCKKLTADDVLVVILSGGSEDLLCLPKSNIGLEKKVAVLENLRVVGATDDEVDLVRKKMSSIRAGGLANIAYPAKVITLIMSDVPGDDVVKIAGGPTFISTFDISTILEKYGMSEESKLFESLEDPLLESDTNRSMTSADHHVIASINDALDGMTRAAFVLGLVPLKLSSSCVNHAKTLGKEYVKLASWMIFAVEGVIDKLKLYNLMLNSPILSLKEEQIEKIFPSKDKWGLGLALLMGGQSMTKSPIDPGRSGPNQELALYFSFYWYLRKEQYPVLKKYIVWFLGCNTTGRDGNTEFGGAYGYDSLAIEAYLEFNKTATKYTKSVAKYRQLLRNNANEDEIQEILAEMKHLDNEKKKIHGILPETVLENYDVNSFFLSCNDGDELYRFGCGKEHTFTDIGDLHIIRIANST